MNNNSEFKAKLLVKNTILLYFRMFITMAVGLYTSRVILNTLGIEDYGIYTAVGGMVGLFGVISGSLSAAISRDITYELGTGNMEKLKDIFSTSIIIQLILSFLVIVIGECAGLPFLNNKMTIPDGRMTAAHFVLQFSLLTFAIDLISVPYNACIIAHEKMNAFAYISVLDVVLKLLIVFVLKIFLIDKLVLYAILMFIEALCMRLLYGFYCKKHFEECKFRFALDKKILYQMFSFAGWNFMGAASAVFSSSGINLLLNIFFGPIVNASRGISNSVNGAVSSFVNSFMTALNPQITKAYAEKDDEYLYSIVNKGAKYSYYLILLMSLPILLNTEILLKIWLKQVPEYASVFVRLALICSMIDSLSNPIVTLMLATGKIKKYSIIVGSILLMNFPISYCLLKFGFSALSVYVSTIIISIIALFIRIIMISKITTFSKKDFIFQVILRIFVVTIISGLLSILIYYFIYNKNEIFVFIFSSAISLIISLSVILCFGMDKAERFALKQKIFKNINYKFYINEKCTGCGLCFRLCPRNAIKLKRNREGFIYPEVIKAKCVNCHKCEEVCPVDTKLEKFSRNDEIIRCYSKNIKVLKNSSSGGIFYHLAKLFLSKHGVVYGHSYSLNNEVVCSRIVKLSDLHKIQGSKYVESNIMNVYSEIEKDLKSSKIVLFSGTPCQVMSIKRFCKIKNLDTNLYTIDIVCHGVASPKVFSDYIKFKEFTKKTKISNINFKDKREGWCNPNLTFFYENGEIESELLYHNLYIDLFEVKNYILRDSCFNCNYAGKKRIGDLTLGDYWTDTILTHEEKKNGVSLMIVNSNKGIVLLNNIKKDINYSITTANDVMLNTPLWKKLNEPRFRKCFLFFYHKTNIKSCIKVLYGNTIFSKVIRTILRFFD